MGRRVKITLPENTQREVEFGEKIIKVDSYISLEKYDTIIVDPPRAGLSKKVIDKILEIKPEKIVYTSCNPNTLKRDIKLLECNYSVKEITPVNMFPKTEHVECVCVLKLK